MAEKQFVCCCFDLAKESHSYLLAIFRQTSASNLNEQKALLRPVLKLLKQYQIVVVGDREFRSVELAQWLHQKQISFVFRQKKDTYIQVDNQDYRSLKSLPLTPGMKWYLKGVKLTKSRGFGEGAVVGYWKRKYRGKQEQEGWYLLTNLPNLSQTLKTYQTRSGIESMFRDCKSGGYSLADSYASVERLNRLVLLIAIAYTFSCLQGVKIKCVRQQKYINRLQETGRTLKRHSNFWIGLYGQNWLINWQFCSAWVRQLMALHPNKMTFFRQGLEAMNQIQSTF